MKKEKEKREVDMEKKKGVHNVKFEKILKKLA